MVAGVCGRAFPSSGHGRTNEDSEQFSLRVADGTKAQLHARNSARAVGSLTSTEATHTLSLDFMPGGWYVFSAFGRRPRAQKLQTHIR